MVRNELIWLAGTERWVATEFEVHTATDTTLQVRMRGVPVEEAPSRIKAATLARLRPIGVVKG
jgi:SHS2 domain-containing protein